MNLKKKSAHPLLVSESTKPWQISSNPIILNIKFLSNQRNFMVDDPEKTRFHSIRSKELNNNPTRTLFSNMNSLPFNSKVEQINCALNSKA